MKQVPGYTLVRTEDCPEQHGTLTVLTHDVSGATILLVEQNANMALKIADLAYVLETGTITMSGTGAELLADSRVKEAYLGKSS